MKKSILVLVFVIVFAGLPASAVVLFDDEGYHLIDYVINDDVEVSGVGTQVDVKEGGSLNKLWAYGNTIIDISGGTMTGLQANDNSLVTVSGGTIGMDYVYTFDNSQVIISGGHFNDFLLGYMSDSGYDASVVTFIGSAFQIDGNPASYGQYFASDDPYVNGSHIHITGVLQNGDLLDDNLSMYPGSSFILVPEPATLLLLGLGSLALLRKRKK